MSVHRDDMAQTPTPGSGESFGLLEVLLGVSPFVFLVGVLAGIVAGIAVWPVAGLLSDDTGLPGRDPSTYLRGPVLVGGVGLLVSVVILDMARGGRPEQVGPALAARLLLVGGCLSAAAHRVEYRDATPDRRRANGYAYAAFVVVWTAISLGLYSLWG